MIFTNSIPYSKGCEKVKQLSIANIFASHYPSSIQQRINQLAVHYVIEATLFVETPTFNYSGAIDMFHI